MPQKLSTCLKESIFFSFTKKTYAFIILQVLNLSVFHVGRHFHYKLIYHQDKLLQIYPNRSQIFHS